MVERKRNCRVAGMRDELPADRPAPTDTTADPSPAGTDASLGAADAGDVGVDAGDGPTDRAEGVPGGVPADQVTRSVVVDAGVDDVWRAVADLDERALWLDDPDAALRQVRIDESAPGHRLVWTWWHPGDEGGASTVAVVLAPAEGGGTRVVVTETIPAQPRPGPAASLSARAAPWAMAVHRAPAWLRCATDRWDGRLLGLELRFVAARVPVA